MTKIKLLNHNTNILHLHIPKTAGSYVFNYLKSKVLSHQIVPKQTHSDFWCDYSYDELKKSINLTGSFISTHFFTPNNIKEINPYKNHTYATDQCEAADLLKNFRDRGWFTFTFVRNPLEQICSAHAYAIKHNLKQICNRDESLESFSLRNPISMIPFFWKELDYIAEFCDFNMSVFLAKCFHHDYTPLNKINTSENMGFNEYKRLGLISNNTDLFLRSTENYKNFLKIRGLNKIFL